MQNNFIHSDIKVIIKNKMLFISMLGKKNKLWYIQTIEYYSSLERAIKPWKDMKETYAHITKRKKPIWKGCTLWFQFYNTLEKAKLGRL